MGKLLSRWFDFDYDIIGEYLEFIGNNRYRKQYLKRRKFRKKAGGRWHYLLIL